MSWLIQFIKDGPPSSTESRHWLGWIRRSLNGLRLNLVKCKLMRIGHSQSKTYHLRQGTLTKQLQVSEEEKDLGIYTTSRPDSSTQCYKAATKAASVLGIIRRNFPHLSPTNFLTIYKAFVRPHIQYCIQVWNPHLVKDIRFHGEIRTVIIRT